MYYSQITFKKDSIMFKKKYKTVIFKRNSSEPEVIIEIDGKKTIETYFYEEKIIEYHHTKGDDVVKAIEYLKFAGIYIKIAKWQIYKGLTGRIFQSTISDPMMRLVD